METLILEMILHSIIPSIHDLTTDLWQALKILTTFEERQKSSFFKAQTQSFDLDFKVP